MKILDMLPELDAKALATVLANAHRLVEHGNPRQREQALGALPVIEAEQTRRAGLDPVPAKVVKAKPVKTKVVKAPAKRAVKRPPAEDVEAFDEGGDEDR